MTTIILASLLWFPGPSRELPSPSVSSAPQQSWADAAFQNKTRDDYRTAYIDSGLPLTEPTYTTIQRLCSKRMRKHPNRPPLSLWGFKALIETVRRDIGK